MNIISKQVNRLNSFLRIRSLRLSEPIEESKLNLPMYRSNERSPRRFRSLTHSLRRQPRQMIQCDRTWKLGLTVGLAISEIFVTNCGNYAFAQSQIVPDRTLGSQRSIVKPDVIKGLSSDRIDGGARRGANLFHSFREFNVGEGRGAYFINPNGIENILSRVTGTNPSNILGKLGVLGNANLFLINPNGIVFGQNASLDVKGSFVATTADAVQFGDRGFFSATDPNSPPLLTVKPSAFLFNQTARERGSIENNSIAPAGLDPLGQEVLGLRVPDGQSLLLLGGNVNMNGGRLYTYGGRVELGGISGEGTVKLNAQGNNLSLSFPNNAARGYVSLHNGAVVNTTNSENVIITARNLSLSDNARLTSSTFGQRNAGNIEIRATDSVSVGSQSSLISVVVGSENAGNILIEVPNGTVSFDGLFTIGTTWAIGAISQSGNIFIKARSLFLSNGAILNTSALGIPTGANAGNIQINVSDSVLVSNGGFISSSSIEQGNAGNVNIAARGAVSFDGVRIFNINELPNELQLFLGVLTDEYIINDRFGVVPSGIGSSVESLPNLQSSGRSGDITITARSLSLNNGAFISASNNGRNNAGKIDIDVRDEVTLSGFTTVNLDGFNVGFFNRIQNALGPTGVGKGGGITIEARSLKIKDLSNIISSTFGQGNAGNISIQVDDSIILADFGYIRSNVEQGSRGNGGNIDIQGRSLTLTDGSGISAEVQPEAFNAPAGRGDGGNIRINTTDFVNISGVSSTQFPLRSFSNVEKITSTEGFSSGLFVSTREGTSGSAGTITVTTDRFQLADGAVVKASTANAFNAGSITINANTFEATNGGQVVGSTEGSGDAGNITLNIADRIALSGSDPTFADRLARFGEDIVDNQEAESGIFASTTANSTGNGGSIFIDPTTVIIQDGAQIAVNSQGTGEGGDIKLLADSLTLDNDASISAETASTDGGNIDLQVQDLLLLRNDSRISTTAGTAGAGGNGGDIDINSQFIIAVPLEDSNIEANAFEGSGGNIDITTQGIFGIEFRESQTPLSDITASSEFGVAGNVQIDAPDTDPSRRIVNLPTLTVEAEVVQACTPSDGQQSEFIITGRGGLPPSAIEAMDTDAVGIDWVTLNPQQSTESEVRETSVAPEAQENAQSPNEKRIIEAQGLVVGSDGKVILTAQAPTVTPHNPWLPNDSCKGS
jgi:filamentous hemagglutinin family protein